MEGKFRGDLSWRLVAAIAPIAWGSNYFVTHRFLPAESPVYGGAIRALPAGLLLIALCRQRPHGVWWWRSAVLGTLNMGGFFVLVYIAAQRLPTSVAAPIMATSPVAMMLCAWALLGERPLLRAGAGAMLGFGGVVLMLSAGEARFDAIGVSASVAAMAMSSLGYVLSTRWGATGHERVDVLALTSWQLIAGGIMLVPVAVAIDGAPPALDRGAALAFGYVVVIATAVAFVAWFAAFRHLRTGTVGLIGLLNPVTGLLLGTIVAAEPLTAAQLGGVALVFAAILAGRAPTNVGGTLRGAGAAGDERLEHEFGLVDLEARPSVAVLEESDQFAVGTAHDTKAADVTQTRRGRLFGAAGRSV